jgi:general secretion pathway protein L
MDKLKQGRMELGFNSPRARLRDLAYHLGLPRFWRWWTGELAPLVPATPRGALQRRLARPVIEFGEGEAVLWRPELVEGSLRLVRAAAIPLSADAAANATGRAAIEALMPGHGAGAGEAPRVVIALPAKQILRKELTLPMAVEENLVRTLAYDLDRHTPFRPDQVYFDAAVIGRDPARKTIRVDWAAALRSVVDAARRHAENWGAAVVAVLPGPASATPPKLNLLPAEARARRMRWRQWQVWAPTAVVAVVAVAAVLVPLLQKREYAIALLQQTESARLQAEASDRLRREFERLQNDYNYALARKYLYPGAVQIIDDVTRVLPDDTWLSQLELKTTTKGKDTQRDMFLRGESANGSRLISLLEDTKRVEQAGLRSPTTKLQPGPGEVFDLGAQVRPQSPPAAEIVSGDVAAAPEAAATAGKDAATATRPPAGAKGATATATPPAPPLGPAATAVPPARPAATPAPLAAPPATPVAPAATAPLPGTTAAPLATPPPVPDEAAEPATN